MSGQSLGDIRGQLILDVKQALRSYTAVRQEHVSTVTALSTGGGAIAATGAMIAGAGIAMAGGLLYAVNAAAEFERRLDFFGAVANASVEDMELIRQKALQLGADTIYSADQIAESFTDLAKAGVGVDELLAGIGEAVVNLGAATDMPLSEAATSLTTILNTFGIAAEDAVSVVDKLAGAANSSSIDVGDLITTMTYAGASAKTAGISFEDVNTAIALLGERGIKGSKAGTGLRQMFDKLIAPTKKGSAALEDLGIITDEAGNKLLDAQGKLRPIPELLDTLNGSLEGMTQSQKIDILGQIFPITSLPTILNLLDGGSDALARLNGEIGKTTAMDVASKRLDNLSGDIEILRGNLQTLAIEAGSPFQNFARAIVQGVTAIVQAFNNLPDWLQTTIISFTAVGAAALILLGSLGLLAGSVLNLIGLWIRMAPALTALVGILGKAATAIKVFLAAMLPGPISKIAAILLIVAAALTYFFTQTEQGQALWAQFMGMVQTAVAAVMPILTQLASTLGTLLMGALQALLPILAAVGEFFMGVLQPILAIITPMIAAVSDAFSGIGTNATGIAAIGDIFNQIVTALVSVIPVIVNTLVTLVTTIITTLVGLATQLIPVGIKLITSLLQGIITALPQIIPPVINGILSLVTALIGMLPTLIAAAMTLFQGLITGIVTVLPMIIAAVIQLVLALVTALIGAIPIIIDAGIQLLTGLLEAIPVILPLLVEGVLTLITSLITALVEMLPTLLDAAITLFMSLVTAVLEILPILLTTVIELIPVIIAALISMIPVLLNAAITLFTALVNALPKILPKLISGVIGLIPKIVTTLIGAIPQILSAAVQLFMAIVQAIPQIIGALIGAVVDLGYQLIQGLARGISNAGQAVFNAIGGVVNGAIDWAKGLLGIKSPSRVFMGIGEDTITGLVIGLANEQRTLERQMTQVTDAMTDFYDTVGAAAELDASLNLSTTNTSRLGVETPSLESQLLMLSGQLAKLGEKDSVYIENLEVTKEEGENLDVTLPNAIRTASYLVG